MINSIKNGDQPLLRVTQVSIAGTSSTEQPPLKDKYMSSDQEKKIQKIDHLARSLLIQGLPNDMYSLIDSNKTKKDLWDALARHMLGSKYGEQDRKVIVLYEYETFKATKGELLLDTYIRYLQKQYATMMRQNKNLMDINIDALYNILKQNQGDVNDAMGLKKKTVVVTSDSLALIAEKTTVSKRKEKVVVSLDSEGNLEASSSSDDDKISEVLYYLSESESKSEYETSEYYDNTTTYGLFVNDNDDQEIFHDCENFLKIFIESQIDHNDSVVDHNDSEGINKLIRKFNKKIAKCLKRVEKANQQNKDFENQNKELQDKYDVLKNQATTFEMKNKELDEQLKVLIKKNGDFLAQTNVLIDQLQVKHVVIDTHVECQEKYAKLEAERYEYMIKYSAYFDNDKQYRKQIADQEVLYDIMSVQLAELDKHVRDLKNIEKDFKIFELEECVRNKDLEIEKSKDLRPTLYDERVINLGHTPMFLTHYDEALEIEKFKRARENKIEFAYDYGNLNASYVNEKIYFSDDYFQEIINPDFEKIDSSFQQTSSLKPYVPFVILKKIIIDLEDEVVSILEKEKENLKTIESLKLKNVETGVGSSKKLFLKHKIKVKMIVK
nr:hypothetical protein [Tanacetum cinerariifolium]